MWDIQIFDVFVSLPVSGRSSSDCLASFSPRSFHTIVLLHACSCLPRPSQLRPHSLVSPQDASLPALQCGWCEWGAEHQSSRQHDILIVAARNDVQNPNRPVPRHGACGCKSPTPSLLPLLALRRTSTFPPALNLLPSLSSG